MDSRPKTSLFPSSSSSNFLAKRSPYTPSAQDSMIRPSKRTMQHPSSTTPKAPPNPEYFDFIHKNGGITMRDLDPLPESSGTSLSSRSEAHSRITAIEDYTIQRDPTESLQLQQQEQQQHQDNDYDLNMDRDPVEDLAEIDRIPLDSHIMAFARKSIMQSASTQPRSIFSRLNEKKRLGTKPASLASTQPPPREPKVFARTTTGPSERSKPSPVTSALSAPKLSSIVSSPVSSKSDSTQPIPSPATVTTTASTTTPKPSVPQRGVLDFSGGSAALPRLEKTVHIRPPTTVMQPQPISATSRNVSSVPEWSPLASSKSNMEGVQHEAPVQKPNSTDTDTDKGATNAFDLRALLRQV